MVSLVLLSSSETSEHSFLIKSRQRLEFGELKSFKRFKQINRLLVRGKGKGVYLTGAVFL